MEWCRPPCPPASRHRPTARCPTARSKASGSDRSGSTCTCRSARSGAATATSTPTPPRSWRRPGRVPGDLRRDRDRGDPAGPAGAGRARRPGLDGLLRRRYADPARPGRPRRGAGRGRRGVRAGSGRRGDHRVQPRLGARRGTSRSCVAAGLNRISFGMQSAVDHVLTTLDRTHDPLRVPQVVDWARPAGFDQVSLDLIYGTPGESLADWEASLEAALACEPDHLSAYSLIVEDGTALARRVRRGELPMPDEDDLADKYLLADERLAAAGLELVRGVELGPRRRGPVPAQPGLLARRRLVGRRARRALPRRRHPLVERQAPCRVRRPARPPAPARRTPARSSTPRPAGSSGCCSSCGSRRPAARGARRRRPRGRARRGRRAAPRAVEPTGWC